MTQPIYLVDGNRLATKIKSASETYDLKKIKWKSNPTRACPNCNHTIDNSDVAQEWPGLPRGVKFDPSDQEIIWHLIAKVGGSSSIKPHPFIGEFIPTVDEEDGICYTHPQKLPGVKQDGGVSHFFHRAINAYNTGTRKRRKVHGDESDVRWHKTGKTKPVILDGVQRGCKKIMVLYMNMVKGGKPEKTNWVMHQYHLGTGEEEKDREYVVSKIFYQQQAKAGEKVEQERPSDIAAEIVINVDPVTPKSSPPEPPRVEKHDSDLDPGEERVQVPVESPAEAEKIPATANNEGPNSECGVPKDHEDLIIEDSNWWEGESQFLLDSQQLVEGLSLCDELLQSQPAHGDEDGDAEQRNSSKPRLSDYSRIGAEILKKDLEECQNMGPVNLINDDSGTGTHDCEQDYKEESQVLEMFDPSNFELDTPPDFRLSQLDFGSQDNFFWDSGK